MRQIATDYIFDHSNSVTTKPVAVLIGPFVGLANQRTGSGHALLVPRLPTGEARAKRRGTVTTCGSEPTRGTDFHQAVAYNH